MTDQVYDKPVNPMHEEMRQELLTVAQKYLQDGMPHMDAWAVVLVVAGNIIGTAPPPGEPAAVLEAVGRNVLQGIRMRVR